jgi:hypothetical protein
MLRWAEKLALALFWPKWGSIPISSDPQSDVQLIALQAQVLKNAKYFLS